MTTVSEIARDAQHPSAQMCLMVNPALIEQELAAAEAAWKNGNEGKARVCARRAVALATEAWLARLPDQSWRGDAMEHRRHIQQHASLPLSVRQAAERLNTTVTRRHTAPDPIGDARVIVAHLAGQTKGTAD